MSTSKNAKATTKPSETDIIAGQELPENLPIIPEDDSSVKPPEDPLPDLPVAPIPGVAPPTPVVQETTLKVPQDYNSALLMMADATRILQDKESLSRTLGAKNIALQEEVDKKEANRNELDADIEKKRIELENINQKINEEKIAK